MIRLLLTKFKNILLLLIISAMVVTSTVSVQAATSEDAYFGYRPDPVAMIAEAQQRQCEVIIRVGEYKGKAGKRIYLNDHNVKIPYDIPIRNDNDGRGDYVHEVDINIKEGVALVAKLKSMGVDAKLQVASDKSEDLNAAGRKANKSNPYLYISIHHNSYDENSTGYFAMYNPGNAQSQAVADRLSNAIQNNRRVPQRASRANTGYIGEMNVIHGTTTPVLLELGFFSNYRELENICSDEYVSYVSSRLAKEIKIILDEDYR